MSESISPALTVADGNQTVVQVQTYLEAYLACRARSDQLPSLELFLPAQPPVLRRLVLIELIKSDLDYRWRTRGEHIHVEQYWQTFPELHDDTFPCDLIYEEFRVRRRAGDEVQPEEYFQRFPEQTALLRPILASAPTVTTAVQPAPGSGNFKPGDVVDDFEILLHLGTGAFASVFLARQRSLSRRVALKISAQRDAEPQTLAQLDHPGIVRVYDQRPLPERGVNLLYMQYVPGGTLQGVIDRVQQESAARCHGKTLLQVIDEVLERHGDSPPNESALRQRLAQQSWPEVVCWLGARLAEAIDHAHAQGVLHRDIKPANILVTAEGLPRLADFNVSYASKIAGAGPAAFFGGSLAYMSPEQLEAVSPTHPRQVGSLDGRSDLYSLGMVLWELLTGKRPFPDPAIHGFWVGVLEQLLELRYAGVKPPVPLPPGCPAGLEETLRACLQPDPAARPESGRALAAQLDLCLKPQARQLLYPRPGSWRQQACRHPIALVFLITVAVNAAMALFNFVYNAQEIIGKLLPSSQDRFLVLQAIVNAIAFPAGITVGVWWIWPVSQGLRLLGRGQTIDPQALPRLRRRCLQIGVILAVITLTCWTIAGIVYPLSMQTATGLISGGIFFHFVISLLLCGLIAASYPFFATTFVVIRAFYPALLRQGATSPEDRRDLQRIKGWLGVYLVLASVVPLLAMTVLSMLQVSSPILLGTLGVGGLLGFVSVFALAQVIRADIDALLEFVP